MTETEIGRHLVSVEERDIDLLLMEEFHISEDFVTWFCGLVGLHDAQFDNAWHSVSDADGETDLLLRVIVAGRRVGVMIENKINAPEQHLQSERYLLRGERLVESGSFAEFTTAIMAPQRYLDDLPEGSTYRHRISYESIAEWYSKCDGRRSGWRHHVVRHAIEQGRRGYTMLVHQAKTRFHREYWNHLRRNHPRIQMAEPGDKGPKSDWIILKDLDFPKDVQLNHKFEQRVMELGFFRRRVEEILEAKGDWPDGIIPIQKSQTASLMIEIPYIDLEKPFEEQVDRVEQALAAAYSLLPYARLLVVAEKNDN